MKRVTILIAVFVLPLLLLSQENKFEYTPKVKSKIEVVNLIGKIELKNAKGNALVIESDFNLEKPERADGLNLLGSSEDNTQLGINVFEKDGVVTIAGVTKKVQDYTYTISVPEGMAINIDYHNPFANDDIEIDSYNGSVELKALTASIKISNCTGPFTVNTISGDIEATFSKLNQEHPTSLASVSGLVDVTLPENTKANIKLKNITGDVYNNLNLVNTAKNKENDRSNGLQSIGGTQKAEYTLNGGGQKLILNTISGNIYLRKK